VKALFQAEGIPAAVNSGFSLVFSENPNSISVFYLTPRVLLRILMAYV
jgi:hypothetical protein